MRDRSTALTPGQRWVLAVASAAMALVFFDQTASADALATIGTSLHASATALQWVVGAFLLAMAALIPVAGRLGDRFGRRRLFLWGVGLVGLASLGCALASTAGVLVAWRAVEGVGAAAVLPLALANVTVAMPAARRGWAVGVLAAGGSVFLSLGPFVGGAIVDLGGWRWIFFVNLPVVAACLALGRRHLTESVDERVRQLDVRGMVLLAGGLAVLVTALLEAGDWGAASAPTLATLLAGVALLGAFVVAEHRVPDPLLHVRLLRVPVVAACLSALVVMQFAVMAVTVELMLYLQEALGFGALLAGIVFVPAVVATPLLSPAAGRLGDRPGGIRVVAIGLFAAALSLAWVALAAGDRNVGLVLPALALFGLARPFVFTPSNLGPLAALPGEDRGLASSLAWEAIQVGAALGLAVSGVIVTAAVRSGHFVGGFRVDMAVSAGLCLTAAVVVRALLVRPLGELRASE